ncbi:MAG: glutamate--tRNA ligase [Candidatus Caldatribacteriota bacterium]|nr:glutamate--tRNA ligase [Atribacterota bacterium]MDD3640282.1 glutamate--tRNA ligase [Atribacterota bacterium]MDD4764761.1 glutamate--tRNA ligase [Atribacterota bacterium]MDI9597806.1 glutamate--tRNA ligase [Atribacterota bacterium]
MNTKNKKIRVRFAPSPTGYLHIGGARTALFNWLYARHYEGTFVLRIEDTDRLRSTPEAVKAILDGMKWLGLDWDEGPEAGGEYGPYFQMQRLETYKEYTDKLLADGKAYECYCTAEELEERRKIQLSKGGNALYDRKCLNLSKAEKEKFKQDGRNPVIRLKMPGTQIIVNDLIKGRMEFDSSLLTDFVIIKSDGIPTYNFAVVIDDILMKISLVMRGDDHISNTPKQIVIYNALDAEVPYFAHIPMIMGPDNTRLSKRHGATSVMAYKEMGFLPEAVVNYIAHLGWSSGTNQEVFTIDELIKGFTLKKVSSHSAIFDMEKLNWFNGEYLKKMTEERYAEMLVPYLQETGLIGDSISDEQYVWLKKVISLMKSRVRNFRQFLEYADYFFTDNFQVEKDAVKVLKQEGVRETLGELAKQLDKLNDWSEENIEQVVRNIATEMNLKGKQIIHPTRVSLSGKKVGPSLFALMEVLGKEINVNRLMQSAKELEQ